MSVGWNLILFNEHERESGDLMLLMRKHQCMHCADPGCLEACPADGAIVQYANGIVDFQQDSNLLQRTYDAALEDMQRSRIEREDPQHRPLRQLDDLVM